ncbi:MAG TPA: hypothetical protein VLJ21_03295 [Candidatus Binatia bacterium]|nr:hypothetical protein [Candidatus Binatia bacterium]
MQEQYECPTLRDGDLLYFGKPVAVQGAVSEITHENCLDCGDGLEAHLVMHNNSSMVLAVACKTHPQKVWSETYRKTDRDTGWCFDKKDKRFPFICDDNYKLTGEFSRMMDAFDLQTFRL